MVLGGTRVLERGPTTSTPRDGQAYPTRGGCRFCGARLSHVFADLGVSALANSYLTPEALGEAELFYPLRALVCAECLLVQLEEYESPAGIFSEYAYFSSYSSSWMDPCQALRRARDRSLWPGAG